MLLTDLSHLTPSGEQAVIINAGTRLATTLAFFSALRHAGMPVLIIDCQSGDGSWEHFMKLMETYEFDLLSAPLRKHGETLDWLFRNTAAEKILLVDSDVEILDSYVIRTMKKFIDEDKVFGSGFVHGPCWLPDHQGVGYYHERMWIPLTMLKVPLVRQALEAGHSFIDKTILNDFGPSPFISRLLHVRFRFPSTRHWTLPWLNWSRKSYYGQKPCYVYCDTGTAVYQFLKYQRGFHFAGFPAELHQRYVTHFHGVTRSVLNHQATNCAHLGDITHHIRERLLQGYGVVL